MEGIDWAHVCCMFISTVGGRALYDPYSKNADSLIRHKLMKPIILFSTAYLSTKNIKIALIICIVYYLLLEVILQDNPWDSETKNKST